MAGYSSRPLSAKLGLKPEQTAVLLNAPEGFVRLLEPLPPGTRLVETLEKDAPFVHIFATTRDELAAQFPLLKQHLAQTGMLWVSWPKKAARRLTDLDENKVRAIGLENGLVDVKVAAVDEIWSGLKFMYRTADRMPAGEAR